MSSPPRSSRLVFAARFAVGIVLLVLVLIRVGLREPWRILSHATFGYLVAAIALYATMFLLKMLRWRTMLHCQKIAVSPLKALDLYLFSSLFGAFTPGRVGEAVRAIVPAREGKRYAESLACTAVDKAFDVLLLAVLLVAASRSALLSAGESRALLWSGVALVGIITFAYIATRTAVRRGLRIAPAIARLLPGSWRPAIADYPDRFAAAGLACVRQAWLPGTVLTALFWVAHVGCHYLILQSLGAGMDIWYFVLCLTLCGLVEFVPVTVCGLGTREYLLIFLFAKAGLGEDVALAFALMNIIFTYALTGLFSLITRAVRVRIGNEDN